MCILNRQAVQSGQMDHFQTVHQHRDGHLIPVDMVNTILETEGQLLTCSIVRDITDRVRAEEQLRETYARLKKANEELARTASTDQLTNAWNRRHFSNMVDMEIERVRRYKQTMSLLLLDIDHFKNINDRFGHQLGDIVLVNFAKLIRTNIRNVDSLTRWGGAADAMQLAERLRLLVAAYDFPEVGLVTVSIGVAEFKYEDNLDSWIRKADEALYRAKELGRNRVELSI